MRTTALLLISALAATACASNRTHEPTTEPVEETVVVTKETAPAATQDVEMPLRYPEREANRMRLYGKRAAPTGERIRIDLPEGGVTWADALKWIAKEAGVSIRYDARNAKMKSSQVSYFGEMEVARDDLIAWAQDQAFYDGIVLTQLGPADRREYAAMDLANPLVTAHPTFVDEDDIPRYAGRVGLYVSCVMTLPDGLEASRARNALSQLSTRTAGIGRVSDVGKSNVLVVSDFASVVANMRRALDEMAKRRYEASVR